MPAEMRWLIKRDATDPTSGSLQGVHLINPSLRLLGLILGSNHRVCLDVVSSSWY